MMFVRIAWLRKMLQLLSSNSTLSGIMQLVRAPMDVGAFVGQRPMTRISMKNGDLESPDKNGNRARMRA